MGAGFSTGGEEEEENDDPLDSEGVPGPVNDRRCTDVICLFFFIVYCCAFCALSVKLKGLSNIERLFHGKDHGGQLCGMEKSVQDKPYVYYPKLHEDFAKDRTLTKKTGICVEDCPKQGNTATDYITNDTYFVPLPSIKIFGRCVPLQKTIMENETRMCAWPKCNTSSAVTDDLQHYCGLRMDRSQEYWIMSRPDDFVRMAWKTEGKTEDWFKNLDNIFTEMSDDDYKTKVLDRCEVAVVRDSKYNMELQSQDILHALGTRFTGAVVQQGMGLWDKKHLVLAVGLGGSIIVSFVIIALFPFCVKCVLLTLTWFLFMVLVAFNYILYVQAGIATGRTGAKVFSYTQAVVEDNLEVDQVSDGFDKLREMLLTQQSGDTEKTIYTGCSVALSIGIVVLLCLLLIFKRNIKVLVALLKVASQVVTEIPSLLVFPFLGVFSICFFSVFAAYIQMCVMTMVPELVYEDPMFNGTVLKMFNVTVGDSEDADGFNKFKMSLMCVVLFTFLYIYFFHLAFFTTTVAGTVSHWYFYRLDPDKAAGTGIHSKGWYFGRPVIYAMGRIVRYHLGSLALGSFILAVIKFVRLVLEYINEETKEAQEANQVLKIIMCCTRCCAWCFDCCIQFLTEYAYIKIAISGKPFCSSAKSVFKLILMNPVQVSLDTVASTSLQVLACLLVPATVGISSWFVIKGEFWGICCIFIIGLSYMVTRLAVGVWDIVISALFVCAFRDKKMFDLKYAPDELKIAMGYDGAAGTSQGSCVELQEHS